MEQIKKDAMKLLNTVGVTRIVVVDDEYAVSVEKLLGICSDLTPEELSKLPILQGIHLDTPDAVRTIEIRKVWKGLNSVQQRNVIAQARQLIHGSTEMVPDSDYGQGPAVEDFKAAESLEGIFGGLEGLEFVPLSLGEWQGRVSDLRHDAKAANTLVLFDRDFRRENPVAENEGLIQVREAQSANVGYYGLISHTIHLGSEYEEWINLSQEHNIVRDRFVVIAKARLNSEPPDYYGFLGMLRLTALSDRYARVKCMAWTIFEASLCEARKAINRLSVLDFDRMIFASSRKEGVWEPETLFRVFGILMRREASARLHLDRDIISAFADARGVSTTSDAIEKSLEAESKSNESVRLQRFEIYDSSDQLNNFHLPVNIGDVFRLNSNNKNYILLAQPCDLMVRENGERNYDKKYGRMATLVEFVSSGAEDRENCGELPFYEEETGNSVFVNFARVHHVPLVVLDLCTFCQDGSATISMCEDCPEMLIEPWKNRYQKLRRYFRTALNRYVDLISKGLDLHTSLLAFPGSSNTLQLGPAVDETTLNYGVKRTIRLRQPWSGALLTRFAQYHARAAFDHYFGIPVESTINEDECCVSE